MSDAGTFTLLFSVSMVCRDIDGNDSVQHLVSYKSKTVASQRGSYLIHARQTTTTCSLKQTTVLFADQIVQELYTDYTLIGLSVSLSVCIFQA